MRRVAAAILAVSAVLIAMLLWMALPPDEPEPERRQAAVTPRAVAPLPSAVPTPAAAPTPQQTADSAWSEAVLALAEELDHQITHCNLEFHGRQSLTKETSGSVLFLASRMELRNGVLSLVTPRRPGAIRVLASFVLDSEHAYRLTWTPQPDTRVMACDVEQVHASDLQGDAADLDMHVLDEHGNEVSEQATIFAGMGEQLDDELADLEASTSAYDRALARPDLTPDARALLEEWAAQRAQAIASAEPGVFILQ